MQNGPRETVLYVIAVQTNLEHPDGDYLATIDCDPKSCTYSTVIHRTYTKKRGNELHHSGWNTCSSCFSKDDRDEPIPKRDKLICPALNSNRVYVFDMAHDQRKPVVYREIDSNVMHEHNVSAPHTTHCMYDGTVLISTMGDNDGNAKGEFLQFDAHFNCLGTWTRGDKRPDCGYDFWYQPHIDVLVASEWGKNMRASLLCLFFFMRIFFKNHNLLRIINILSNFQSFFSKVKKFSSKIF